MMRAAFAIFLVLLSGTPTLAAETITPQHLQHIETLQRRADSLAFGGMGSGNYHLAKARTWLDFALSEYYVMDSSGVVPAAIEQAEVLLAALEQGSEIPPDAPLQVPGGDVVRSEAAATIGALKRHTHFSCGQRQIAEAEVFLVWSAHEEAEYGQSHGEPYLRAVENRIQTARASMDDCAAVPAAPPPVREKITLSGDATFDFGTATLSPTAMGHLDAFVDSIREWNLLESVELTGHTDHLSRDGRQGHNLLLSKQRAESIKQYLVAKGIPEGKIQATGFGSSRPLVRCPKKSNKLKMIACLRPNRRVEIALRGIK